MASLGGVGGARLPQLPLLPPLLHLADVGGEQRLQRRDEAGEGLKVAEANLPGQETGENASHVTFGRRTGARHQPSCGRRRWRRAR